VPAESGHPQTPDGVGSEAPKAPSATSEESVRAEPFDAIELHLATIFAGSPRRNFFRERK